MSVAEAQHLVALAKANATRLARAHLKARLRRGEESLADALLEKVAVNMPVEELIGGKRGWGTTRTRRAMRAAGVPDAKRVGTLTERQRRALCEAVDG